ncbi:MAG TPA: DUF6600 domain-containing protein [Acidobacteriaceae bacterium]
MRADGPTKTGFLGWVRGVAALALALGLVGMAQGQQIVDDQTEQQPAEATQMPTSADPPSRVARLSFAQGNVSVEPASVNQFSPAEVNYPLTTGDRVWTDNGALAEVEGTQLVVRIGQATDLTVVAMTDTLAQFGLGQGSLHLQTFALVPGTEIDTPNVAVTVLHPGDVRVDVDPGGAWTVVTVISGQVEVDGNGFQQMMDSGDSVRLAGTDPVAAQSLRLPAGDALDQFSADRDQEYGAGAAAEQDDVNPDTVGGADLAQYGSWQPESDDGNVWFPTAVAVGWQPYCYGRWTWVAPWGWTWIESEPWGFAPFHYGRWAVFGGRWGWIPGPPVVHPVYAPALVVFVHPGSGVSAWFPLGPGEAYAPWYHSSALYLNRVNVSNIYSRNVNQVRTVYNTANREMYPNALGAQQRFANRAVATVAVPQDSLASGRPVRQTMLHLPAEQLSTAAVLPHPMVTPERTMVAPSAARAVPVRTARPTLTSHEDAAIRAGAVQQHPTQPAQSNGQAAPIERRGGAGTQGAQGNQPANRNNRSYEAQPNQQQGNSGESGTVTGAVRPPNPARGTEQLPQQGAVEPRVERPAQPVQPVETEQRQQPERQPAQAEQQQLYNRAVPPPDRPNFDEQRQAIQKSDPGRPLSSQQLDNLRENRPVGEPQVREAAPHPAPAPRSQPAPQQRSSPPPASRDNNKH